MQIYCILFVLNSFCKNLPLFIIDQVTVKSTNGHLNKATEERILYSSASIVEKEKSTDLSEKPTSSSENALREGKSATSAGEQAMLKPTNQLEKTTKELTPVTHPKKVTKTSTEMDRCPPANNYLLEERNEQSLAPIQNR